MPTNLAAAERVLQALKSGEVPRQPDVFKLRMLMPEDKRTGPLAEIANAIILAEIKNRKSRSTSTNYAASSRGVRGSRQNPNSD